MTRRTPDVGALSPQPETQKSRAQPSLNATKTEPSKQSVSWSLVADNLVGLAVRTREHQHMRASTLMSGTLAERWNCRPKLGQCALVRHNQCNASRRRSSYLSSFSWSCVVLVIQAIKRSVDTPSFSIFNLLSICAPSRPAVCDARVFLNLKLHILIGDLLTRASQPWALVLLSTLSRGPSSAWCQSSLQQDVMSTRSSYSASEQISSGQPQHTFVHPSKYIPRTLLI